ncbi:MULTISPECIES: hypothetical protein [Streptomyces]|uniref:Secreted protein n=1 Tax=Streptomyces solicathayae TaxID=3081768 RepID=A0ABZ0LL35_9ACTN|nr:hypothetical protein [Streptomyces sp. HUAS YS2]WOX20201.1 hypothetical protein R2D22_01865 [Streptomyces sp. HUAS YS2]
MKKRSMLAVASFAAGVVTAIVSPSPASADVGAEGLSFPPDPTAVGSIVNETVSTIGGSELAGPAAGGGLLSQH